LYEPVLTLSHFNALRKSPSSPSMRPTPLELASGLCLGEVATELPAIPQGRTPIAALEAAVLPALRRPPCLVAFSGGRDSSGVLAVAAAAARRHGLAAPVPATLRFSAAPRAEEDDWQELVVRHLGLADWMRVELGDELDYLGPLGSQVLLRHGVLWPPNAYFFVPLLERARGGSLLTGDGGDLSLAAGEHGRIRGVAGRQIRPERRDLRRLAAALAPAPLRRPVRRRAGRHRIPWLRPAAQRQVTAEALRYRECEPVRFDSRVRWLARLRETAVVAWTGDRLAGDTGAELVSPLVDPFFLSALARTGGALGWSTRTEIMRALFGGLLPDDVLARPTKADFAEVFWGPRTREFVVEWSGEGVDPALVDRDALRAAWSEPHPLFPSAIPLRAAWLHSRAGTRNLP
jgi:asparagine synthase (glutamine-hydrolysing)